MELKILNWLLEGFFFGIGLGIAGLALIGIMVPVSIFVSFIVDHRKRRKFQKSEEARARRRAELERKFSSHPAGDRS